MTCMHCGKPIGRDEEFAAVYGPPEDPKTIVGHLHMKCSEELEAKGEVEVHTPQ